MKPLLIATSNAFKIREFAGIAKDLRVEIVTPTVLRSTENLSAPPAVEETEPNYFGNALLKARAYAKWGRCNALADDSGLEIDALDGRPGVLSARYCGENATDVERQEKVMEELRERELSDHNLSRKARYRCTLIVAFWNEELSDIDSEILTSTSTLEGEITREIQSRDATAHGNFGYNPIVHIPSLGGTLSAIPFDVICKRGFRAIAASQILSEYSTRTN